MGEEKKLTKQQRYQIRNVSEGKCRLCGHPICEGSRVFCEKHLIEHRERNRRKYREKKGIPDFVPLAPQGSPRKKKRSPEELEEEKRMKVLKGTRNLPKLVVED